MQHNDNKPKKPVIPKINLNKEVSEHQLAGQNVMFNRNHISNKGTITAEEEAQAAAQKAVNDKDQTKVESEHLKGPKSK